MTSTNVGKTERALRNRQEVEQLDLDGDTRTEEAVFRAIVNDSTDEFEAWVEDELDVEVVRSKWVVFGEEVVLR